MTNRDLTTTPDSSHSAPQVLGTAELLPQDDPAQPLALIVAALTKFEVSTTPTTDQQGLRDILLAIRRLRHAHSGEVGNELHWAAETFQTYVNSPDRARQVAPLWRTANRINEAAHLMDAA